jgi:hypothetical protein
MIEMIGKLQRVPLREVWGSESLSFMPWLQDNLDVLNEILDISLSSAEREQSAGAFSIDLVAEDEGGNPVIIENQLEKSDHDHLGKLITYLTAIGAKSAIWIVADPRPEHVSAISWLNESHAANFYFMKVEAVKIGESPPAPLLTLIVGPSETSRKAGEVKEEIAERYVLRQKFWAGLLEKAKSKTRLHANISPSQYSYIGTGAGKYGLQFNYDVRKHDAFVELYIDRGDAEENKSIFETLRGSKDSIEAEFGEPLQWQRLEGKRASRIIKTIEMGGYRDDESRWPEIHEAMIDAMIRLEKSMRPYIAGLQI